MTRTMTEVELDQRAQLAALMAPRPERGIHPSELAPPGTADLIRKTVLTGDKPEARTIDDETGSFEAIVSTWELDRQGERFTPGAFRDTITRWRVSGKQLPVLFAHDATNPSMLVGAIDPQSMHETTEGLHVKGRLDLESRRGRDVYGLLRRGAPLGWSVGFGILPENVVKQGAHRILTKVSELLEISLTPTPANAGTRTLAVKDIGLPGDDPQPPSHTELEERLAREGIVGPIISSTHQPEATDEDVREGAREAMAYVLGVRRNGDERKDDKAMVARAKASTPITIATFRC
jgi:Escherichia/Staphylococcus phage prohead protease